MLILGMMRRSKAIKKKSEMADAEPKAKKAKVDIPDADDEDLNLDDSTDDSADEEEGMEVQFFLKYLSVQIRAPKTAAYYISPIEIEVF